MKVSVRVGVVFVRLPVPCFGVGWMLCIGNQLHFQTCSTIHSMCVSFSVPQANPKEVAAFTGVSLYGGRMGTCTSNFAAKQAPGVAKLVRVRRPRQVSFREVRS